MLKVNDLSLRYSKQTKIVLDNISFSVKKGETIALIGKNGSGKSSILNVISGLIPNNIFAYTKGKILFNDIDITEVEPNKRCGKIGSIFQNPETELFSPTVEDEIAFAPENLNFSRELIDKKISEVLAKIGIENLRYENPNNLSGGQKQLVAIASVLSSNPEILLCDEIFSNVDYVGREKIKMVLKGLKQEQKSIIIVDHNLDIINLADRILKLENGKLIEVKKAEIFK